MNLQEKSNTINNKLNNVWANIESLYKKLINSRWFIIVKNLLFLALIIWALITLARVFRNRPINTIDSSVAPIESKTIDKNGDAHVQLHTIEVQKEEINQLKDELAIALKNRDRLNSVTKVVTKIDTVFKNLIVYIDTNNNFSLEKQDEYIHAYARGNTNTKTGEIGISGIDSLTYTDYTKVHYFQPNERIVDIKNHNKYIDITHGKSIVLKEPKTIISSGLQAGYNPFNNKFYGGIGIQLNLLNIIKSK